MSSHRWALFGAVALVAGSLFAASERARFVTGGALVNAGYRMQDDLARFDFKHGGHEMPPAAVWQEFLRQNALASEVRSEFPRARYHPVVAMVVCMDARIDTNELAGDTRRYYYVIRTAGSVMSAREEEMLELAVENGVRLVVLTTHTDCAAERVARDPERRGLYPHLVEGVTERERRVQEFLARPAIASRIARGELMVRRVEIDTHDEHLRVIR